MSPNTITSISGSPFASLWYVYVPDLQETRATLIFQHGEYDNDKVHGLPHFVEHLAVRNANKHRSKAIAPHDGAWTTRLATYYSSSSTIPEEALANVLRHTQALKLHYDEIIAEREIVKREYEFRVRDEQARDIWTNTGAFIFQDERMRRDPLGTPQSIAAFKPPMAILSHRKTHQLRKGHLILLTPERWARARELVNTAWARASTQQHDMSQQPWSPPQQFTLPFTNGQLHQEITVPTIATSRFYLSQRTRVNSDVDVNKFEALILLASDFLQDRSAYGMVGALYYDDYQINTLDLNLEMISASDLLLTLNAKTSSETSLGDAKRTVLQFLDNLQFLDMPEPEFARIKGQLLARLRNGSDKLNSADYVFKALVGRLPVPDTDQILAAIEALTQDDLRNLFSQMVTSSRRATVFIRAE
ncbi:insulinase family protein [Polycladidibacter hongkongensis]|uniref:insulinase family protein n=1 Tax=Polycladidibacter hongkongensis TaxID=1647556 RepID=UPI0008338955|nr:insulinase family protein [Pseudovibrio hongkongensis]